MMLMDASQMGTGMDPNSQQMMMFQNPYMQMMHPSMQHQLMSSTSPQAQAQQAQPQAHSPAPPRDQDRRDPSMYMISQVSPQHNSSRMSLPMFKDGDNKLSSSYVWFGAVFRYGQRKSLPKKFRLSCIVWMNPDIWTPIRISNLSEDEVDMLIYLLTSVKAETRISDLQCATKYELRELLVRESMRLLTAQPERLTSLSSDLTNVARVAYDHGYPVSSMSPAIMNSIGIADIKVQTAGGGGLVTRPPVVGSIVPQNLVIANRDNNLPMSSSGPVIEEVVENTAKAVATRKRAKGDEAAASSGDETDVVVKGKGKSGTKRMRFPLLSPISFRPKQEDVKPTEPPKVVESEAKPKVVQTDGAVDWAKIEQEVKKEIAEFSKAGDKM